MKLDVIILAAGKGSRMYSDLPKVLHPIAGKAMVQHVVDAVTGLDADVKLNIVVGHGADQVRSRLESDNDHGAFEFIEQTEQLGTGHAVAQALPSLRQDAIALILYGDVPLIAQETLASMVAAIKGDVMSLLTVEMEDPTGYGRIIRNIDGDVVSIVEQKDATTEQLVVSEVNTGIMCVRQSDLARWLPKLSNDNAQAEYYLTDIIAMAVEDAVSVNAIMPGAEYEVVGVNNKPQLAELERRYQRLLATQLMEGGVSLADPDRIDIRGEVSAGRDVYIDINAVLIGKIKLGDRVSIGPNCVLIDADIGADCEIKANSIVEDSKLSTACMVGPFARLRPGTELSAGAKIGNFVEIKKSIIGEGSKVNHLSYVGDAELGKACNVGAGTITCNYDGANKYKTELGDQVFVGSNSTLVAPLTIKDSGFVGAGSTITQEVPGGSLAVGRTRQKNIPGWKRPEKN